MLYSVFRVKTEPINKLVASVREPKTNEKQILKMPKTASIFLIFFVFASCKYKENSWLNNYKEIKCKYAKIEELRRNDSLNKINKLGKELAEIKTEISKIDKPIIEELANLENSRSEIVVEYLSKSNQIIDQQTDKFGHNSTPEFEKKLSQNEKEANSKTKVFENKIEFLNQKLAENNKYQELKAKEGKIKSEIAEEYISIKEKYSKQLENLQYDLNYLNAQFKKLTSNLNTQELKTLTKKRDSIKQNPCNFTIKN